MADDILPFEKTKDLSLSRRGFAALSVGATGALASQAFAQEAQVVETDVTIKTADGSCDAVVFHPPGAGTWPAVLTIPDALGLRPVFRTMGRQLAAQGFTVLTPNPFYRTRKAPVLSGPFDFANTADRAKLTELTAPLTADAKTRDITAYLAYLDTVAQTRKTAKVGAHGYCMGGSWAFQAAVLAPNRVGAVCSFHGGGLVSATPDSPHLSVGKSKAQYLVAIADGDDQRQPDAKDKLREAFAAAKLTATVEVYAGCAHGWCVNDGAAYNKEGADKAFAAMTALYKKALV